MKSVTALLWLAVAALPHSVALAGADYRTYLNHNSGGTLVSSDAQDSATERISYQSQTGGVWSGWTLVNGDSLCLTSGRADAGNLNLGVRAAAMSTPLNGRFSDAYMNVGATNSFTVRPGTSGLAADAPITLRMNLRLDGSLYTHARAWRGTGWAHAEINASLKIVDPAIRIDMGSDGFYTPSAASFGAWAEMEAYHVNYPTWNYTAEVTWDERWSLTSNTDPTQSHNHAYEQRYYVESMLYTASDSVDTGMRTIEFEALVGHTLNIDAWMYTYVNANTDGQAQADFYNTFALGITPVTPGVELEFAIVPEPGALSLVALAAVALLRQRRVA